jgi:hypothetical protein
MSSPFRSRLALYLAAPLLLAGIVLLQRRIDAQTPTLANQQQLLIRSGPWLKKVSLGYDTLLGEIYWTRTVQYYGSHLHSLDGKYDLLWPLLDITTTLEPHLIIAYHFGAIFLSEPLPIGAARPDLAVELVKRGIAQNPSLWQLDSDLGFIYYWNLHDYSKSSAAYLAGSKKPGAKPFMALMAARVAETGGSIETSRMVWTEIYSSATDPRIRRNAVQHLEGLTALRDLQALDDLAGKFHDRFGRYPASENDLVSAGYIPGLPADPQGMPYIFDAGGKARLDPRSSVKLETRPTGPPSEQPKKSP